MKNMIWSVRAKAYEKLEWSKRPGYLQDFVAAGDFQPTDWVLDVGAGTGIVAHVVAPLVAKVVGIDISLDMLEHARISQMSNEIFEEGEASKLHFPDAQFDKVMARMVFHHLVDDGDQAIQECYRVLKPGGLMILSEGTPPDHSLKDWYTRMFALKEQRLTFFEEDLMALMSNGGFSVDRVLTYVSPQVSIGNWLRNSGLPPERQDRIMQMHFELDEAGRQHYNMVIADNDVLCDFKYITLVGSK